MTSESANAVFWNRVLTVAEMIENHDGSIADIQGFLCGLEEGFAGAFDPADAFPEFVTLDLCRSIGLFLSRLDGMPR